MSAAAPRASIIICTYRRREALARAVESACAQDFPTGDLEVVVVNNDPSESLGGIIDPLRARGRAIREVACAEPGLSFARNAGIAAARGEVLVFIDDDAIADADLVERVVVAFGASPDLGVIGGKIILKEPEPRPWWWDDRARPYWSHFDRGQEALTRVAAWRDFPWGANWSARRAALERIGGFPTKYGRVGKGFAGGEEIAAAAMIMKAGWGVAIEPRARVVHEVDPARFTLADVRRTILAGTATQLRLQQEGFIAAGLTFGRAAKQAAMYAAGAVIFLGDGVFRSWEAACFMEAHARLAWRIATNR